MEELAAPLLPKEDHQSAASSSSSTGDEEEGYFSAVGDDEAAGGEIAHNNEADGISTPSLRDEEEIQEMITSYNADFSSLVQKLLHTPLLPNLDDDPFAIQIHFLKFLLVTLLGIAATHYTVLSMVSFAGLDEAFLKTT